MKKILYLILLAAVAPLLSAHSQTTVKMALTHADYDSWKELAKPAISADGVWVTYEVNPQKGDGYLHLHNLLTGRHDSVARGSEALFSSTSDLLAFRIKQPESVLRKQKVAKTKKEDLQKDSLGIRVLTGDSTLKFPGFRSLQVPKKGGPWIAYLQDVPKEKDKSGSDSLSNAGSKATRDTARVKSAAGSAKEKEKKSKKSAFSDVETAKLTVINPVSGDRYSFENVTEASFSRNGRLCAFITLKKDSADSSSVMIFDTRALTSRKIFEGKGLAKKAVTDDAGLQVAWLHTGDTAKVKRYTLRLWNEKLQAAAVADTASQGIPAGWEVSDNGLMNFSEDGSKLYFGTAPKVVREPKDTLLEEEKPKLDVWNWQDSRLQSQQLKELNSDLKRSYSALYRTAENKIVQLADTLVPRTRTIRKGNSEVATGYSNLPYELQSSWEEAGFNDVYLLDLKTGMKKLLLTKSGSFADLSPGGKYLCWYQEDEKAWYTMDLVKFQKKCLTAQLPVAFYNELHDTPSMPNPYGMAGWTRDDAALLVYDRYDIWQLDPTGQKSPVNLTVSGRREKTAWRYVSLDPEELFIDPAAALLLKGTEEESCRQGFATLKLSRPGSLTSLARSGNEFSFPLKAKEKDQLIWQKSSYRDYPDLWTSRADFTSEKKLSRVNPQQDQYRWGTVEHVRWTTLEGKPMRGLLYKPENFDSTRKYPMIIYYYERYSERLYSHFVPSPSRSTVNFPYYNSNGYLVFVPDIAYTTGQPGQDAYNSVMSGTLELMKRPYVDEKNIGLQGQSWGGYQTAWLVTRTGLFKAAMAGAPVSNMTSAYGGIRYESGRVREFQYEHTQSRIGGNLWEKRELYIDNSPLFFADRITTPLLIMSNDNDGAVPHTQGIEFFTALRRLGKPAWMLVYNGEEHNLTKRPNRMDLSLRMSQFFDHYLKGEPMPLWMKEGVPAVKKGKE